MCERRADSAYNIEALHVYKTLSQTWRIMTPKIPPNISFLMLGISNKNCPVEKTCPVTAGNGDSASDGDSVDAMVTPLRVSLLFHSHHVWTRALSKMTQADTVQNDTSLQ